MTPLTADQIILRARSAIGYHTIYGLGDGGRHAAAGHPANGDHKCDCSGFACWSCGLDRRQPTKYLMAFNGGWLSTDGILHDAARPIGAPGFFRRVDRSAPGDLVVYPDHDGHQGHVGVVVEAATGFEDVWFSLRVIHCSRSNWHHIGDAIMETDAGVFRAAPGVGFVRLAP